MAAFGKQRSCGLVKGRCTQLKSGNDTQATGQPWVPRGWQHPTPSEPLKCFCSVVRNSPLGQEAVARVLCREGEQVDMVGRAPRLTLRLTRQLPKHPPCPPLAALPCPSCPFSRVRSAHAPRSAILSFYCRSLEARI